MNKKNGFFENVTEPEERAALIKGFFAAHGVPGGRKELVEVKETLRREKAAAAPELAQG